MPRTVEPVRQTAKSGRFPEGNRNFPPGNPISPVMQAVKARLEQIPNAKPAWELHKLTVQPISICQKTLSGHRVENRNMLVALVLTELGWDAIDAIVKDGMARGIPQPTWHAEVAELQELHRTEQDLRRAQRTLQRRRQASLDRGGAE